MNIKKKKSKRTAYLDVQDVKAHYRLLIYMVMSNVFCAIVLWTIVAKAHN
jgi:hypothetical protein